MSRTLMETMSTTKAKTTQVTHWVSGPDSRGACATSRPEQGRRAAGGPWPGGRAGWPCPSRRPTKFTMQYTSSDQGLILSSHLVEQGPVVAVGGQLEGGVGHGHKGVESAPGCIWRWRNRFTVFITCWPDWDTAGRGLWWRGLPCPSRASSSPPW